MDPPLNATTGSLCFLLLGAIYPTEAVNDQVITTSSIHRRRNGDSFDAENSLKDYGFALMQCGIPAQST